MQFNFSPSEIIANHDEALLGWRRQRLIKICCFSSGRKANTRMTRR
jgi:hypothetical protein